MAYKFVTNKNIFKRDKYASTKASDIEYFQTLSLHHEGFHVRPNYPYTNVKKMMVYPKNVRRRHCSGTDWKKRIKEILKGKGGVNALCELRN